MNIYFILCQLIATITFLIMCKLILVAPTSKFFSISLYVYIPFCASASLHFPDNWEHHFCFWAHLLFCFSLIKPTDYTTFSFFRFYGLGVF